MTVLEAKAGSHHYWNSFLNEKILLSEKMPSFSSQLALQQFILLSFRYLKMKCVAVVNYSKSGMVGLCRCV